MLRPDKHSQARKTPDAHTKGNRMKIGKYALGLAFLLLAGAAQAIALPVVMTETPLYRENGTLDKTEYSISNNLLFGTDIVAFGVTNSSPNIQAWTTNAGWTGRNISRQEWDAGLLLERYCDAGDGSRFVCNGFETGTGEPSIEYGDPRMGSFESLFGTADEYVNFYWLDQKEADGQYIWAGESMRNFFFNDAPASEYAAFSKHGELLYRSTSIPEPGAMALLGLGLAGIMVSRRGGNGHRAGQRGYLAAQGRAGAKTR